MNTTIGQYEEINISKIKIDKYINSNWIQLSHRPRWEFHSSFIRGGRGTAVGTGGGPSQPKGGPKRWRRWCGPGVAQSISERIVIRLTKKCQYRQRVESTGTVQ